MAREERIKILQKEIDKNLFAGHNVLYGHCAAVIPGYSA